jgi:hypothetical protein
MPPSAEKPKIVRPVSSGALPALIVGVVLIAGGAATVWYERGIEARALSLAGEIGASVVPEEALVPSAVKTARLENVALAASITSRFAPRTEPVVALRTIELAADRAGIDSSFARVEVGGWDGAPENFGALNPNDTAAPYAGVVAGVQAQGAWAQALSLAAALDTLPLASRVDSLRLASGLDATGRPVWVVSAQVSVAAK